MGMGVHGGRESTGLPESAPFKEGEGPPGQGGKIVQGRAQAAMRVQHPARKGRGRYPYPSRLG